MSECGEGRKIAEVISFAYTFSYLDFLNIYYLRVTRNGQCLNAKEISESAGINAFAVRKYTFFFLQAVLFVPTSI